MVLFDSMSCSLKWKNVSALVGNMLRGRQTGRAGGERVGGRTHLIHCALVILLSVLLFAAIFSSNLLLCVTKDTLCLNFKGKC